MKDCEFLGVLVFSTLFALSLHLSRILCTKLCPPRSRKLTNWQAVVLHCFTCLCRAREFAPGNKYSFIISSFIFGLLYNYPGARQIHSHSQCFAHRIRCVHYSDEEKKGDKRAFFLCLGFLLMCARWEKKESTKLKKRAFQRFHPLFWNKQMCNEGTVSLHLALSLVCLPFSLNLFNDMRAQRK